MRKIVLSLAAAGAALLAASPAAAQYHPRPQPAYGYNNGYGMAQSLQVRIDNIQRQINRLDRRDRIRDRTADRLRDEANRIERRLRVAARNGLNPYEARDIHVRISRLEQQVHYSLSGRFGRYGYNNYNGYGYDRDRDGRDDRYENDRGWDRDD